MKKLLFVLVLLAFCASTYAEGPLFRHKDPAIEQEFNNVYQDLRSMFGVSGALRCLDLPTLCVDFVNHKISMGFTGSITAGKLSIGGNPSSLTSYQVGVAQTSTITSGTNGGVVVQVIASPASTLTGANYGLFFESGVASGNNQNFTANPAGVIGVTGNMVHRGNGVVTGATSILANGPNVTGSGSVTTGYGLYVNTVKLSSNVGTGYAIYNSSNVDLNYFAGKVGFNTTRPAQQLHLSSGTFLVDGTSGEIDLALNNKLALYGFASSYYIQFSAGLATFSGGTSSTDAVDINSAGVLRLKTASTNRIYVENDGDVGIGTDSPRRKLDVNGHITTSYKGYHAGIYTFRKQIAAGANSDIFSLSGGNGAQAFMVIVTCDSNANSMAKTYQVAHQFGVAPVVVNGAQTAAYGGTENFTASFTGSSSQITMNVSNTGTQTGQYVVTVFMGAMENNQTLTEL